MTRILMPMLTTMKNNLLLFSHIFIWRATYEPRCWLSGRLQKCIYIIWNSSVYCIRILRQKILYVYHVRFFNILPDGRCSTFLESNFLTFSLLLMFTVIFITSQYPLEQKILRETHQFLKVLNKNTERNGLGGEIQWVCEERSSKLYKILKTFVIYIYSFHHIILYKHIQHTWREILLEMRVGNI